MFTFKFASKRSTEDFCDKTTIESGQLIGEDNDDDDFWFCYECPPSVSKNITHGGTVPEFLTPLSRTLYQCTSFSIEDDWTAGENTFIATFPAGGNYEIM